MLKIYILDITLKITNLSQQPYLPRANELIFHSLAPSCYIAGESGLTVDALAKHDNKDGDTEMASDGASDTQSFAGKTFNTWATNWTECTNTTFSKVHRYWQSNSALHKEVRFGFEI